MQLIVFAHKNEAESFIDGLFAKKVKDTPLRMFEFSEGFILISGEGLFPAQQATAAALGKYGQKINKVINIGVCGALPHQSKVTSNEVYSIRTAYAEEQFKSFVTADNEATVDCISAYQRVLTDEYADKLSAFAATADREAWSIASTCKLFNVPFYSYKLISDFAGNNTNCFEVKESSVLYSQKLFQYYLQRSNTTPQISTTTKIPEAFYLTTSQKQKVNKLLNSLSCKLQKSNESILACKDVQQIAKLDIHPKKRTQNLIEYLSGELTPFQKQIKQKLNSVFNDFQTDKFHVSADSLLESDELNINMKVANQEDFAIELERIKSFPFSKIHSILHGKDSD